MSWEPAYSFGTSSAQPPTPTQTPTSGQFPTSPAFDTPRNNSSFENRGGWTPTFAEEYSVFHTTPGRLTGGHNPFLDTPTIHQLEAAEEHIFGEDISTELASHVHHLSPNPSVQLPPVDPTSRLSSSPNTQSNGRFDDSASKNQTPRRPSKRLEEAFSGQTATPPQSATKGSRKLAPKIALNTMQNETQNNGLYGMSGTPTHNPDFSTFPPTSTDMYGYPMSAPATAPAFSSTKPFWDTDANISAMDLDFTTDDAGMFNTGHRISNSFDWGRSNQMFQDHVNLSAPAPAVPVENNTPNTRQPTKRQRPLAPKVSLPAPIPKSLPPFEFNNTATATDNPFGGSVDPGLLYSRSNSISMPSVFEDVPGPAPRPATSHVVREPYQHQLRESMRDREEIRRSRSTRERSSRRSFGRETVSSPVRGSARPALSRSVSDGKGKVPRGRIMPRPGRTSPVKSQRSGNLHPIPESPQPGPRTEVIFTIDSNGKARTETVVVGKAPSPKKTLRSTSLQEEHDSSPYESSSDEEPIIVPSRNSSFSLPTQPKGPKLARFDNSQQHLNAMRRQSTGASGYSHSESSSQQSLQVEMDGVESEAETVMEDDDSSGDATRELRKVMEDRKKNQMQLRHPRHHRYSQDPRGGYYNSSANISPTTISDPDGTPTSSRAGSTRCVCGQPEDERFMIQCESCENWLHAECVNLDQRSVPSVYICRFCANTPNLRRGNRIRESTRTNNLHASSPLAHKSFKSFR